MILQLTIHYMVPVYTIIQGYGRLNMHLDYEKHPILENRQRRLNIIYYLNDRMERRMEWCDGIMGCRYD